MTRTLGVAEELANDRGVETEVVDLLTLQPLDRATVTESLSRTGRGLVIHDGHAVPGSPEVVVDRLLRSDPDLLDHEVRHVGSPSEVLPLHGTGVDKHPTRARIRDALLGTVAAEA